MTNVGRVMAALNRSDEGRTAIAVLGESYIANRAESPRGAIEAWEDMTRMDSLAGMRPLGDLMQRVCGAIEEARGWL
jgi:hypothetical protein